MHAQGSPLVPQVASDDPGVTALLLFDYGYVGLPGEDSVFGAIRACLERSEGVCALNDAGLLSSKALESLTHRAVETQSATSGLLDDDRQCRWTQPSAAAMWTDRPENVQLFHRYLDVHAGPRYRGTVLLDEGSSFADFLRFCARCSAGGTNGGSGFVLRMRAAGMAVARALADRSEAWYAAARRITPKAPAGYLAAGVALLLSLAVLFLITGGDPEVAPVVEHSAERKVEERPALPQEGTAATIEKKEVTGAATEKKEVAAATTETTGVQPPVAAAVQENTSGTTVESTADGARARSTGVPARHNGRESSASSALAAPSFTVQVGSFLQPASASALAERLTADGYPASVSTVKVAGGATMHRVRVGAFATRREAHTFGEQLIQKKPFVHKFFVAVRE